MKVFIGDLKLSALKALLGNVFPNLRAVCVDSEDNLIKVYFYHKNPLADEEKGLCEKAISQIMNDFSNPSQGKSLMKFEMPIIRIDYPKKMPLVGFWVFFRQEDSSRYID
jgi:hypothetical protein